MIVVNTHGIYGGNGGSHENGDSHIYGIGDAYNACAGYGYNSKDQGRMWTTAVVHPTMMMIEVLKWVVQCLLFSVQGG